MKKINYLNVHNHTKILNLIRAWILLGFTHEDIIEFVIQYGYDITLKELDALIIYVNQQIEGNLNHESME